MVYWNLKDTADNQTEVAENSSWDQANRGEKLGLVWRNRKKISQIIKDYFYLPFFLLIILWFHVTSCKLENQFAAQSASTSTLPGSSSLEWPPTYAALASIWFLIQPAPSLPFSTAHRNVDTATWKAVSRKHKIIKRKNGK